MGTTFNIYGYIIYGEGNVENILEKEYGFFKCKKKDNIDLYIKPVDNLSKNVVTYPPGGKAGFYIPYSTDENVLLYEHDSFIGAIPHYVEMLMDWPNMTLLHAGGVSRSGKGYLFVGGGGVGKTSSVLNLSNRDYLYLGDDWLVVDQNCIHPFPKTIHVFDYNITNKNTRNEILGLKRFVYQPVYNTTRFIENKNIHRFMNFLMQTIRGKLRVDADARKIFSPDQIGESCDVEHIFYLERSDVETIEQEDIDAETLARKMALVTLYERSPKFFREYYKYAFKTDIKNPVIESRYENDFGIFKNLFKDTSLSKITIPSDVDLTKGEDVIDRFQK